MAPNIRIPTLDAPAAHHLKFILQVTTLAHAVIEKITGLRIVMHTSVHGIQQPNNERARELVAAAQASGCKTYHLNDSDSHTVPNQWDARATVSVFVPRLPAAAAASLEQPVPMCHYIDCLEPAMPDLAHCATHESALRAEMGLAPIDPDVTLRERLAQR